MWKMLVAGMVETVRSLTGRFNMGSKGSTLYRT